ncbi:hypothetical protein PMSD_15615 [Paenibacillus macquariensis subsp. defensor]|nr:hypothetical protein PMSD_15615 [Paenibacillus macquariensis subsp. defensor]
MSLSEDSTKGVDNLYNIYLLKIHTLSLNLFLPYKMIWRIYFLTQCTKSQNFTPYICEICVYYLSPKFSTMKAQTKMFEGVTQ